MLRQTFYFDGGDHNHHYFSLTLKPKKGGTMINKEKLMGGNKDFFCEVSEIVDKLLFVSEALNEKTTEVVGALDGAARIVHEVAWELKAINIALCGTPGELKEFVERHF